MDGESRERLELRERSSLAAFVSAAVRGAEVKGAEAEVSAAHGCPHGFVPWEMLEVREAPLEYRDVTPAPSTTGIQQAAIQPSVFLANALSFLGIDMPVVDSGTPAYPVLSTKVTAEARDKGVAGPATAGAYTVTTTSFKRITGAFDFSMEDAQKLAGLEESLRENIGSVMGSAIDEFGLNGQAAVSNKVTKVHGLMGPSGNNNQEIVPATAEGTTTNVREVHPEVGRCHRRIVGNVSGGRAAAHGAGSRGAHAVAVLDHGAALGVQRGVDRVRRRVWIGPRAPRNERTGRARTPDERRTACRASCRAGRALS